MKAKAFGSMLWAIPEKEKAAAPAAAKIPQYFPIRILADG